MKETIIIEATNDEGTTRRVAMDTEKEQEIGKEIMETIRYLMDKETTNTVKIEIDYTKL